MTLVQLKSLLLVYAVFKLVQVRLWRPAMFTTAVHLRHTAGALVLHNNYAITHAQNITAASQVISKQNAYFRRKYCSLRNKIAPSARFKSPINAILYPYPNDCSTYSINCFDTHISIIFVVTCLMPICRLRSTTKGCADRRSIKYARKKKTVRR